MNITYELFEKDGEVFMVPLFLPKRKKEKERLLFWHLHPSVQEFFQKFVSDEGKTWVTLFLTSASDYESWVCNFDTSQGMVGIIVWRIKGNEVKKIYRRIVGKRNYRLMDLLVRFYIHSLKYILNFV